MAGIITLTTDFGLTDPYVGAMKGSALSINPGATIVDITHNIPPGDITAGAVAILGAYAYFPLGTVHVVVVDPGVGSPRRAVAVETQTHLFVGPDNGVLSIAARHAGIKRAFELQNQKYFRPEVSHTFHGRDIFAPVAAHLSLGADISELGPEVKEDLLPVSLPEPVATADGVVGEVINADSFGNLITNIVLTDLPEGAELGSAEVEVRGTVVSGIVPTYATVAPGELVVLFGSTNRLEIARNQGSAVDMLGAGPGDTVTVRLAGGNGDRGNNR